MNEFEIIGLVHVLWHRWKTTSKNEVDATIAMLQLGSLLTGDDYAPTVRAQLEAYIAPKEIH